MIAPISSDLASRATDYLARILSDGLPRSAICFATLLGTMSQRGGHCRACVLSRLPCENLLMSLGEDFREDVNDDLARDPSAQLPAHTVGDQKQSAQSFIVGSTLTAFVIAHFCNR